MKRYGLAPTSDLECQIVRCIHARRPGMDTLGEPLFIPVPGESKTLSRNFVLLLLQSFSFFLTFAAFNAAQSLNGSIAAPAGLPSASFMAIYIVFALFSIPAPKLLSSIGPKASMALGMLPYAGLSASFLAPAACSGSDESGSGVDDGSCWPAGAIWGVRMTAALFVGLGAPILWTGQGVYLARLASREAAEVTLGLQPQAPAPCPHLLTLCSSEPDFDLRARSAVTRSARR